MALTQVETSGLSGSGASSNSTTGNVFSQTGPFKNRIINGDMRIDQRNAGAAINLTGSSQFAVDRWKAVEDTDGTATAQQSTTVPAGAGFTNSLLFTVGTADATLAATQFARFEHSIEGLNVSDLGWGSASAQPITLSFWVRSSLTGTFGGGLRNSAFNRSYPFSYSISAGNTWEKKAITVPGDTSGTWLTTNGEGISVNFGLGVGSTYSGTAGAWAAANTFSTTGAVNVMGTASATFYLTGVQLEKGTVATDFDFRSYGQQLALCQRYYQTGRGVWWGQAPAAATQSVRTWVPFSPPMRATPTTTSLTEVFASGFTGSYTVQDSTSYGMNIQGTTNSTSGTTRYGVDFTANSEL